MRKTCVPQGAGMQKARLCPVPILSGKKPSRVSSLLSLQLFFLLLSSKDTGVIVSFYNTPDGHFVLDRHPKYDNIVIGAGFSGEPERGKMGCLKADLSARQNSVFHALS